MPGRLHLKSDLGAGLVEFALLVTLIALVAIVAVQFAGQEASTMWSQVGSVSQAPNN
jgi:Flp pilus assembly pilin Flp